MNKKLLLINDLAGYGKDGKVEYKAVIAPHAMDKKEASESKKAEGKTAEKTK